jgi:glycosyl transferase family 25
LNEFFGDEIFYINIDSRKDKKKLIEKELSKLRINANRFSAITPSDSRIKYLRNNNLKDGEIGCFLSHTDLWKDIVKRKVPWTLIFEDDIYIPPGVTQKTFGDSMKESFVGNRNPKIIYFGHCLTEQLVKLKRIYPDNDIVVCKGNPDCTHAYCISYEGAQFFLSEFENRGLSSPIDEMMRKIMNGNSYLVLPYENGDIVLPKTGKNETYFGEGIVLQYNKIGSDIR